MKLKNRLSFMERVYAKGGGGSTTTTTATKGQKELDAIAAQNAKAAQPLFNEAVSWAKDPNNNPQYYSGDTVAQFNPTQYDAMSAGMEQAQNQHDNINPLLQRTMQFGMEGALQPNPYLEDYMRIATDPMLKQYQEQILPAIGSTAEQQGAYGGVRQGLAEKQAATDLAKQMGDMRTQLAFQGYNKGLDTMLSTMQMAPQTLDAMNNPSKILSAIGDQMYGQDQKNINAAIDRFNFEQDPNYNRLNKWAGLINTLNGGQVSNTPMGSKTSSSSGSSFLGQLTGK